MSVVTASTVALGIAGPATAAPAPAPAAPAPAAPTTPAAPGGNTAPIPAIPYDTELAGALRMLKQAGIDKIAIEAAKAILGTVGQLSVSQATNVAGTTPVTTTTPTTTTPTTTAAPAAPTTSTTPTNPATPATPTTPTAPPAQNGDGLALLKTLGINPLTPSVAPLCTNPTADNPLGVVMAGSGATQGPWPMKSAKPVAPLNVPTAKIDPEIVKDGQTAYAFLPAKEGGTGGKMQVAWFNATTLRGGFSDVNAVGADNPLLSLLPGASNIRLAPVDTGKGTVLSAVFGTAQVGNKSCYFLPAVGVVS